MTNIAIFASGNGSNCENIIRYFKDSHDINISLVLCNNPEAKVLQRAQSLGVPTAYVSRKDFKNEDAVMPIMKEYKVDFIVLAGFLVLIPGYLLKAYDRAIVNIHPALLPAFKGAHAIQDSFNYGVKVFGITIHYVSPELDGGKIIAQRAFDYVEGEDIEEVESRIHALEHVLYPETIEKLLHQEERR